MLLQDFQVTPKNPETERAWRRILPLPLRGGSRIEFFPRCPGTDLFGIVVGVVAKHKGKPMKYRNSGRDEIQNVQSGWTPLLSEIGPQGFGQTLRSEMGPQCFGPILPSTPPRPPTGYRKVRSLPIGQRMTRQEHYGARWVQQPPKMNFSRRPGKYHL